MQRWVLLPDQGAAVVDNPESERKKGFSEELHVKAGVPAQPVLKPEYQYSSEDHEEARG